MTTNQIKTFDKIENSLNKYDLLLNDLDLSDCTKRETSNNMFDLSIEVLEHLEEYFKEVNKLEETINNE